jgi:hypothetical protein
MARETQKFATGLEKIFRVATWEVAPRCANISVEKGVAAEEVVWFLN